MPHGWPDGWMRWVDVDTVASLLDAGADPNARLTAVANTPLLSALWELEPATAVVDLLIARGADVEAVNDEGETPLWCAVRRGTRAAAVSLLRAGADAWRPVLQGRSAGRVALDGPLADLFAALPGAPTVDADERRRQAEVDELIAAYGELRRAAGMFNLCLSFVAGLNEDEVIRRLGADPVDCPTVAPLTYPDTAGTGGEPPRIVWLGTPPSGGVVVVDPGVILPTEPSLCARVSAGDVTLVSIFDNPAGGDQRVDIWRDGQLVGCPTPYGDPRADDPPEAWLCRFGDQAHDSFDVARDLALMTMLTGVRPDPQWLFREPQRLVHVVPRPQ